jgi:acetylornithine/succinyldiaminopimelate/putrescine aminotransferase
MSRLDQIVDLEKRFLLPTYNRYPVAFERGEGVFLYDFEGKKYLDFVAGLGVNALGHAHPRIVKAIREQASRVIHISNLYYNEYQGQLAERLCQLSGLDRAFFSNSGTEAMEGAIKLARLAGHKAGGDAKSQRGAARFVSRPNVWRHVPNRPGQVPQGFRAAARKRNLRRTEQR